MLENEDGQKADENSVVEPVNPNADYDAEWDRLAAEADGSADDDDPADEPAPKGDKEPEPDPAPEPKEEAKPEPKADDAPADDEKTVDPWANVPDSVRQEHEALKAKNDQLEQQHRSNEGRYKARERQAAKEHEQKLAAVSAANPDAGKDADPLKEARKDYPELVTPFEKVLAEKDAAIDDLRKDVTAIRGDNQEQNMLREQNILTEVHPDWETSITHPDFNKWVSEQPDYIQDVIERNNSGIVDSKEALSVIRTFELANNISYDKAPQDEDADANEGDNKPDPITGKRNLQKKSASAPSSKNIGTGTEGPRDEFGESFDYYAKKMDKANARP